MMAAKIAVGGSLFLALLALAGVAGGESGPSRPGAGGFVEQYLACPAKKTPPDSGPQPQAPAGRYFQPGSPQRRNLRERGLTGVLLTVSGHVYDKSCMPVARALLDFFQADSHGKYDRKEIRLHGHQYTDARGRYLLRTIVPNHYLNRPPHIHVKAQAPFGPVLDTQLFFPATLRAYGMRVGRLNARDRTFRRTKGALAVHLTAHTRNAYYARFDFVIAVGS
jgi:protocatechuate 3,4-dioxygenase beta subunit